VELLTVGVPFMETLQLVAGLLALALLLSGQSIMELLIYRHEAAKRGEAVSSGRRLFGELALASLAAVVLEAVFAVLSVLIGFGGTLAALAVVAVAVVWIGAAHHRRFRERLRRRYEREIRPRIRSVG
jgi:hypothetical protein